MADEWSGSDAELVERARRAARDDSGAFEALVRRHQGSVLSNCRYLTRSPDDAEDLAQEVFVKAFFGLSRFEGRSAFKTWLQSIKINHCFNFLKKRQGKTFVDVTDPAVEGAAEVRVAPAADRQLRARGDRQRIDAVLDSLSDTVRVPLLLRDLDGLSYQEIADLLAISLSAVKMRIKRGREEFRARYGDEGGPTMARGDRAADRPSGGDEAP